MPELRALGPTEVVMALSGLPQWRLQGDGVDTAIERTWHMASPLHAMLFVHAVGWLAESMQHHPEIRVSHAQVSVRWRTHDVGGLSALDFEAAKRTQALLDVPA